jgi:molybdopterin-guanine dinucleotide biosynthesis protein A
LQHCRAPATALGAIQAYDYLLTVACDTPRFPLDLLQRLTGALADTKADIAIAAAPEVGADGAISLRTQPVFCLMRTELADSLSAFLDAGGRKVDAWTARHPSVTVAFDQEHDDPLAFFNANTLAELALLSASSDDS